MNYINPYSMPTQQIMQANGIESAKQIRLAPNSSALVADTMSPIVYKCMSDSMGIVSVEAYDITPHKTQEQTEQETIISMIEKLNNRVNEMEAKYESFTTKHEPIKEHI